MTHMLPPERQPMLRIPAIVGWLIVVLVAIHGLRQLLPSAMDDELLIRFTFIPARYAAGFDGGGPLEQALPFVTHLFLHADFFHLGMNCVWLLASGPLVARRYGGFAFLVFFFVCGIAGAAAFLANNWGGTDMALGASGAIAGLMAASMRMIPWMGGYEGYGLPGSPLVPLLSKPVLGFTAVWVVTNVIFAYSGMMEGGRIAWEAHLGGFVCGLLLASLYEAVPRRN